METEIKKLTDKTDRHLTRVNKLMLSYLDNEFSQHSLELYRVASWEKVQEKIKGLLNYTNYLLQEHKAVTILPWEEVHQQVSNKQVVFLQEKNRKLTNIFREINSICYS